jgi:hypothetical protein
MKKSFYFLFFFITVNDLNTVLNIGTFLGTLSGVIWP